MNGTRDRGATSLAVRLLSLVVLSFALATPASAQRSDLEAPDEVLAKIDPYTNGDRALLEKLGYFSFGPFPWCAGVMTNDVEEALGERVLWLETAHFKIGSTLATYRFKNDKREEKRIAVELDRLRAKLGDVKFPKGKLDPWLRLHVYALRLEDMYADIEAHVGSAGADDDHPYLGQPQKPTVLLTEKTSSLGRFAQRWFHRGVETTVRDRLPGRSMFTGMSAEQIKKWGFEFDVALHCTLASDVWFNLLDGYKNNGFDAPFWLKEGLAHVAARKIDGRFAIYAAGTTREFGDEDHPWEPRVFGLVSNHFAPSWDDMLAWRQWSDLDAQAHVVVWSRVAWMLTQKEFDFHCFWSSVTTELAETEPADRARAAKFRQLAAMQSCFGRSPRELDAAWSAFVLKSYAKK